MRRGRRRRGRPAPRGEATWGTASSPPPRMTSRCSTSPSRTGPATGTGLSRIRSRRRHIRYGAQPSAVSGGRGEPSVRVWAGCTVPGVALAWAGGCLSHPRPIPCPGVPLRVGQVPTPQRLLLALQLSSSHRQRRAVLRPFEM